MPSLIDLARMVFEKKDKVRYSLNRPRTCNMIMHDNVPKD